MSTIKDLENKISLSRTKKNKNLIMFDKTKNDLINSFFSELFNTKYYTTDKERDFQYVIFCLK